MGSSSGNIEDIETIKLMHEEGESGSVGHWSPYIKDLKTGESKKINILQSSDMQEAQCLARIIISVQTRLIDDHLRHCPCI